jgi:hypothetical protein
MAADANAGAVAGIVLTILLLLILTIGVIVHSEALGSNFYVVLAACFALMAVVFPPSVATYINLKGNSYSYENYILQVFLPMCIGFLAMFILFFFDLLKEFEQYQEFFLVLLGSVSILTSALTYTFLMYRIKYNGT